MRLDRYLVECGYFDSRQKAKEALQAGNVLINGKKVCKASFEVEAGVLGAGAADSRFLDSGAESNFVDSGDLDSRILDSKGLDSAAESIRVEILSNGYVSRAGLKLEAFLQAHESIFDEVAFARWKRVVDVGAARGGFSEVLLARGVEHVSCVDVGSAQLHPKIANDARVAVHEKCDIRDFARLYVDSGVSVDSSAESKKTESKSAAQTQTTAKAKATQIPARRPFDLLVCDVSFIPLEKVFDALEILSDEMILLFKPQFEVGKSAKRNKKGVVQDKAIIKEKLDEFSAFVGARGYGVRVLAESSVKGKEGNAEYFIYIGRAV